MTEVAAILAARARLLRTGHGRKTDGIDALSVAEIAAARDDLRQVVADDATAVMRLLADRRHDWLNSALERPTGFIVTYAIWWRVAHRPR